jgi:alkanesulfonate monooxygenase SsuD/methylene tetrahydromethanopterin reductase-like flavin-dependent oxidoreductase (luciferase family)
MKIGLRLPQIGHATKENIISLAKRAEDAGFDSLWVEECEPHIQIYWVAVAKISNTYSTSRHALIG